MLKTYKGSCHCGRMKFEADIDFAAQGSGKCNCTSCWKHRWWATQIKPEAFRYLGGEEELSGYRAGQERGHGGFCKHCHVRPYAWVDAAEWNDGERVSVSVSALDDLSVDELMSAPIQYMNGRDNDWWHPPQETRHL